MNVNWTIAQCTEEQESQAQQIARELGLSLVVSRILVRRGLATKEEAEDYLQPKLSKQHDPFLMCGMEDAVSCLRYHVKSNRPIMITGDHDVDGVTSVALVHNVLRDHFAMAKRLHYHIPNGDDEGYGISRNCIDWAKALGCELIIAIDTGIKAVDEVAYARREGLDVIICDHHQADDKLPNATAILNPKQEDCNYPNPHLSGCGVGYKLMQALMMRESKPTSSLYNYLDLLGISTAADLVPLIGENRTFLVHGLHQLNSHPSVGIKALIEAAHISSDDKIDEGSIIYKLAPRLNAAGRMQNGQIAVDLLTATTPEEAVALCKKLEVYNQERRAIDQRMTEEAEALLSEVEDLSQEPIVMLYRADWHVGIMGIVAARMAERYRRPTLVMTKVGNEIIGSARSAKPHNIYAAIESCRDLLRNFGGHKYAAGLTTTEECLDELRTRLSAYVREHASDDALVATPLRMVDAQLGIDEITVELEAEIRKLAPYGLKNERPLFFTERMRDAGGTKVMGREEQHLKLRMTDRYCKNKPINGMALGQSRHAKWILSQQAFGICYSFEAPRSSSGIVHLSVKEIYTK